MRTFQRYHKAAIELGKIEATLLVSICSKIIQLICCSPDRPSSAQYRHRSIKKRYHEYSKVHLQSIWYRFVSPLEHRHIDPPSINRDPKARKFLRKVDFSLERRNHCPDFSLAVCFASEPFCSAVCLACPAASLASSFFW